MMPAKRTAVWIIAAGTFAAFNAFSCALLMQVPQLLIAETASDHSSKSLLSTPALANDVHPLPLRAAAARFNRGQQIK